MQHLLTRCVNIRKRVGDAKTCQNDTLVLRHVPPLF